MKSRLGLRSLAGSALLIALLYIAAANGANTLVPATQARYEPSRFPDRIVALPSADPATAVAVAWRTDASVAEPLLQIVESRDSPDLADAAHSIRATSSELKTESGAARHHHARITGLRPDTLYAYRVQGGGTWSEWFQIRTASQTPAAFSFLYFGDAQNSVKSLYSRVIREAWRREPKAAVTIHAGDLINGRDRRNDVEWGEWFDAGNWILSSSLTVVASGNHEHDDEEREGREIYRLAPHWAAQFPVPENGAPGLPHTTYFFDHQGVRFIILDSTSALKSNTVAVQAQWLERVLATNTNRWTVVVYHHPMMSVSLGRDNPPLREHWLPLFERYGVDLVLQGHDHVYGRGRADEAHARGSEMKGPVYVVSVAGPKQYRVSQAAQRAMRRYAENTQLYQVVRVDEAAMRYESWTVSGQLYDAFTIESDPRGAKRLLDAKETLPARRCPHEQTRGGRRDRCWDGTEW